MTDVEMKDADKAPKEEVKKVEEEVHDHFYGKSTI